MQLDLFDNSEEKTATLTGEIASLLVELRDRWESSQPFDRYPLSIYHAKRFLRKPAEEQIAEEKGILWALKSLEIWLNKMEDYST